MIEQIIKKWLLVCVLIISAICLIIVFQKHYIAEAQMASALPLSIILGLSTIAVAIDQKK